MVSEHAFHLEMMGRYLLASSSAESIMLIGRGRSGILSILWWRGCVPIRALGLHLRLVLLLQHPGLPPYESILNGPDNFGWEDWSMIHRAGHWLLPRLQQVVHGSSRRDVTVTAIRLHERAEQVAAQVDGIRSANILDNAIKHV